MHARLAGGELVPVLVHLSGLVYLLRALVLGLTFLWFAFQFARATWRDPSRTSPPARQLFYASLLYLPLLLAVMVLDKLK